MSNGAQAAAAGKRARAAPTSAPHATLTRGSTAPSDGEFMGLLFDDALDVDGAPEAAQISHSQIIERQAETIARLEASAARAKEYKTLTKVKLKEAAHRLKDYRLRVEALMGEAEAANSKTAKLEAEKKKLQAQAQMMKKKLDAKAAPVVAPVVKKPVVKSVAVQTEAKSVRSMLVQTQETKMKTRTTETQTEAAEEPKRVVQKTQVSSIVSRQTGKGVVVARGKPVEKESTEKVAASQKQSLPVVKATNHVVATARVAEKAPLAKSHVPVVAAASIFDAISATIDAELDFSDDDDEEDTSTATTTTTQSVTPVLQSSTMATAVTVSSAAPTGILPSLLDDAISREIDAELDFGSSSNDSSSSSSDDDDDDDDVQVDHKTDKNGPDGVVSDALKPSSVDVVLPVVGEVLSTVKLGHGSGDVDAITAAIDGELASNDDEEHHDATLDDMLADATDPLLPSPRQDVAALVRAGPPLDSSLVTNPPSNSIAKASAPDTSRPGDVEMTLMTMPASISGAVDDISAALDAELATSSSEDEIDPEDTTEPPVEQAAKKPSVTEKQDAGNLTEDVEMAEPSVPDNAVTKPAVAKDRLPLKIPEPSSSILLAEQIDKPGSDNIEQRAQAESETIETAPVEKTLEDVLREKSRALSLSSDSDSSDSSSSSASENGDSVEPNASPAKSQLPANSRSSPITAAKEPPFVPVESLWAAAMAKKVSSPALVGSPVRPLKVRNKREADGSALVEEPGAKKQKTLLAPVVEKPDVPAMSHEESTSTQTVSASSSVDNEPRAEKPAPVKRDVVPASALPPRSWASYKIAIAPQEAENVDVQYVTRTLGLLLKQISLFLTRSVNGVGFKREFYSHVTKHPDVLKLCKMLADEYHYRQITCATLIDAMTRVLRTPRTRQLVDKSLVVISVLFRNVLFRRLRLDSNEMNANGIVSDLHACLLHLRNQAVAGRIEKGLTLPRGMDPESVAAVAGSIASSSSSVKASATSHEISFLAHICAFHTAICHAIDRSDLARVLLVDVLKYHANIKGLYCIHAMVQVDPLLLQKRWDNHGHERRSALRAVIIHVLLVIAAQSREKQETVLFKETAATLLSVLAEAIDEPQLEPVGYSYGRGFGGPSNESIHEFQATLWRDYIVPCVVKASNDIDLFDTASALELLGCFHGDAMMGRHFALLKFENLLTNDRADQEDGAVNADSSGKDRRPDPVGMVKIVRLVGALSRGVLRSHSADHGSSLFVVDEAVRWMVDSFLTGEQEGGDDDTELHRAVVAELTEILMGMSTQQLDHPKIAQLRDAALHHLLSWLTPSRLATIPASSLRQLRLLIVAARPLTETT